MKVASSIWRVDDHEFGSKEMKGMLVAVAMTISVNANTAEPDRAAQDAKPLRPLAACLVPSQVKNWAVISDRRLVVEALGQRYYDISLQAECAELQTRPQLAFRDGAMVVGAGGSADRVCGDVGDAVIPYGSERGPRLACAIDAVRRIDKTDFDAIFGKQPEEANRLLDVAARRSSS